MGEKITIKSGDNPRTIYKDYESHPTVRAPISPPTPGFIDRIRSMITVPDTSTPDTVGPGGKFPTGTGGQARADAIEKLVDTLNTGK